MSFRARPKTLPKTWQEDVLEIRLETLGHALFFGVVASWCFAGPWVRDLGGAGLAGFTVFCWLYVIVYRAYAAPLALLAFTGTGLIYVGLSWFDSLPDAWTVYYDRAAIPAQAYYLLLIYPLIAGARRVWGEIILSGQQGVAMGILGAGAAVSMIMYNLSVLHIMPFQLWGLLNPMLLFLMALSYGIFTRQQPMTMVWAIVTAALIFLAAVNLQTALVALALSLFALFPRPLTRPLLALCILALIVAAIAGPAFLFENLDANTRMRLLLWADAFSGVRESGFIGIGFGKEVVTNLYLDLGIFERHEEAGDILRAGVHNSFISLLFRMGVLGGGLFILFFVLMFPRSSLPSRQLGQAAFLYFAVFLCLFVNVGIESPLAMVGVTFVLGYLLALHDKAAQGPPRRKTSRRLPQTSIN